MPVRVTVLLALLATPGWAVDPKGLDLKPLHDAVKAVVAKHYPKAKVEADATSISFQYNLRPYMVHERFLTGEWQDAREETGPQKGGISGGVNWVKGEYRGMAVLPYSTDKLYFVFSLSGTYFEKFDHTLYVSLKTPTELPKEFLIEFRKAVQEFEKSLAPAVGKASR